MKPPKRLVPLIDEGLIDEVSRQLMSGKEAIVYVVRSGDTRFEADNVVVATGPFQRPRIPAVAEKLLAERPELVEKLVRRWIGDATRFAGV